MIDQDDELRRLCRASRAFEGSSALDRASVQEGLRVRHGIVIGAAAASAVALSSTSAAHGAGASTLATAGAEAGAGAVSAGAVGGVAKVWLAKGTLIWFASGLAGGAVVAAGSRVVDDGARNQPAQIAATTAHSAPTVVSESRASSALGPATLNDTPSPETRPGESTPERDGARPHAFVPSRPSAPPSEHAPPSIAAETRALADVQHALREGHPARALALLDQQAATFRGGELAAERRAARVLALGALGRIAEARALARAFLAENPRSPLAARLRQAAKLEAGAPE